MNHVYWFLFHTYFVTAFLLFYVCMFFVCTVWLLFQHLINCTVCPTHYQTWLVLNNFTINEDIATKFEAGLPHCVRNVMTS